MNNCAPKGSNARGNVWAQISLTGACESTIVSILTVDDLDIGHVGLHNPEMSVAVAGLVVWGIVSAD